MNIFRRIRKESSGGRRDPRFAGTWYEANETRLNEQLDGFFADARLRLEESPTDSIFKDNPEPEGGILAMVVPHAGYMYSGSTAAYAYEFARAAKTEGLSRVFLMGPSHYAGFVGVALSSDRIFGTPLGDLKVDQEVVQALSGYPLFQTMEDVHLQEHSLELQLSFIRHAFGAVSIVPLIVGALRDPADVRLVGQIIRTFIGPEDIVVVSSDFTHFGPRYDYVPFDRDIPNRVRQLDEDAFGYLRDNDLTGFIEFHDRTRCTICGYYPCAVLLSMLPDDARASLLRYRTSRDTGQEQGSNSVSYLALAFTSRSCQDGWPERTLPCLDELLEEADRQALLRLARLTLASFVEEGEIPDRETAEGWGIEITDNLERPLGAFVTLFKKGSRSKELRGCIGYIWPIKPLFEAVIDNTVGAASKDHRFDRVKGDELGDIEIEISVLTPPRRIASENEIELGRHGIVLHIGNSQSVFLPHVAPEFGWTLSQTLDQLCLKAGYPAGSWSGSERDRVRFEVFESVMFEEN
ncbi:MAG: AmmeMemoRadiSam system protein B [Candidatus Melainabacteria bacterium]|nr:AmmeMemoRadiSam system protein B [Candidatus Melainabacteria bacterium]